MKAKPWRLLQGLALPFLFTLSYSASAFYDPTIGRWISRDPIEEPGGINVNSFTHNRVIGSIDPVGLEEFEIWASAFIPDAAFFFPFPNGLDPLAIFLGDGRTQPEVGGSSRAYHLLTIETDPSKEPVVSNTSGGGTSTTMFRPGGGFPKTHVLSAKDEAPPIATVTRTEGGCTTIVELSADTKGPLVTGAPRLHYDYTLRFFVHGGRLTISGTHGAYPAFDLIINKKAYVNYIPTGKANQPGALYFPRIDVEIPFIRIQRYLCCTTQNERK